MSIVQKVNVKLGEKVSECIQAINENKDHFDQHISTVYRHFFQSGNTTGC